MREKSNRRPEFSRRVNLNAAGIDLGSREHYVAIPPERADVTVRSFGCFTEDIEAMAAWLKESGITTVAMESTGVYWVPVFQLLETRGFDVQLVSTRHLKSVPGRKTDFIDCQWIQHLHEIGFLKGSFRPQDAVCVMRGYIRHRDTLCEESTRHVLRMHKALEQMNIQLHKVVTDITGNTGMAIIEAILAGERDGKVLAKLRNYRCRQSEEQIAKALVGDYREEFLFCLRQEVDAFRFIQNQILRCEAEAMKQLKRFETKCDPKEIAKPKNKKDNTEVRLELFRAVGVDLSLVPGFGSKNLLTIFSEIGFDLSAFRDEKAFAAWATLAPRNNKSGGKQRHSPRTSATSRVAQTFRVAAQTLANSKTALGAFYRRMRGRKGSTFANAVTAHKLAKLFFRVLKHGEHYVEKGVDYYEQRYKAHQVQAAIKRLSSFGYSATLAPLPATVP